jgi:hypothetical protein
MMLPRGLKSCSSSNQSRLWIKTVGPQTGSSVFSPELLDGIAYQPAQ